MHLESNKAKDVKIAYIGGGSRGWARGLMSDLAAQETMSGAVYLYDIDSKAAMDNEIIGNKFNTLAESKSVWNYKAVNTYEEALQGADFVVISILPGTFDEMIVDVHEPEKYGIYQSVGDTVGPGGIIRAMRTIPFFIEFAKQIKKYCPKAWVINYTNPMTICIRTLYKAFPEIKAFGCCHEVFTTQTMLAEWLKAETGIEAERSEIVIDVAGINHFTWLTKAKYKNIDLFPLYKKYVEEYYEEGWELGEKGHWMNSSFGNCNRVKFDLFKRYGVIAAAGDRHLAEFCPGKWYLKDLQTVKDWKFGLTSAIWRKNKMESLLKETQELVKGVKSVAIEKTGEEGVQQMLALLGFNSYVTNVNLPNVGQMPNVPLGAVVETNAYFSGDSITPLQTGMLPESVHNLIIRQVHNQEIVIEGVFNGDYEMVFEAFINDPNMGISLSEARELYNTMLYKTRKYLPYCDKYFNGLKK